MILFAKEMERRTEHTRVSRAERRPAFTRSNQWESSTRYEAQQDRPANSPRRNSERRTIAANQTHEVQVPYEQSSRGNSRGYSPLGAMGAGPQPPGPPMPGNDMTRSFRKGQWGGNSISNQPINGGRIPDKDFQKSGRRANDIEVKVPGTATATAGPKMTENKPYQGFVLDPRLSEMSVTPGGWTPPRETASGIKIPKRGAPGQRDGTARSPQAGAESKKDSSSYPWREVKPPQSGKKADVSVAEELAKKRARTRSFLPQSQEVASGNMNSGKPVNRRVVEREERVRTDEGVRPAGLAEGGRFISPQKEVVG